uniref:t-SNARE coiled-coil homology domain-containing protein n=1 Tax=Ananas comosus var. bracteatus TaxID=296719 RepID=A0A6V7PUS3_ANACO|nr:unnamed protein product [Ananas comosus var. bracteatus]
MAVRTLKSSLESSPGLSPLLLPVNYSNKRKTQTTSKSISLIRSQPLPLLFDDLSSASSSRRTPRRRSRHRRAPHRRLLVGDIGNELLTGDYATSSSSLISFPTSPSKRSFLSPSSFQVSPSLPISSPVRPLQLISLPVNPSPPISLPVNSSPPISSPIDKLQSTFHQWERTPVYTPVVKASSGRWMNWTRQFQSLPEIQLIICGLDEVELGKQRNWTSTAHNQVRTVRRNVEAGKEKSSLITGLRQDLTGLPCGHDSQAGRSNHYGAEDNDDFFSSESDRQLLLIKQQDEELDELSASVQRIGGVGLTIHEELIGKV